MPASHVDPEITSRIAHRFRAFERAPAGEDGKPPKQPLLGRDQQPVTPVDRVAKRLLARRRSRAPPVRKSSECSRRARMPRPETLARAAASSIASGRPSSRRQISATPLLAPPSAGSRVGRLGALREQSAPPDCIRDARTLRPDRQRQWRHRILVLAINAQHCSAGHEHLHMRRCRRADPRRAARRRGRARSCRAPAASGRKSTWRRLATERRRSAAAGLPQSQHLRDRGHDTGRIDEGRQRKHQDATGKSSVTSRAASIARLVFPLPPAPLSVSSRTSGSDHQHR